MAKLPNFISNRPLIRDKRRGKDSLLEATQFALLNVGPVGVVVHPIRVAAAIISITAVVEVVCNPRNCGVCEGGEGYTVLKISIPSL